MTAPLRITRTAKTINAKANELRLIETTAKLAKQQGKRLTVSVTARGK
jgi:hypothetical protein